MKSWLHSEVKFRLLWVAVPYKASASVSRAAVAVYQHRWKFHTSTEWNSDSGCFRMQMLTTVSTPITQKRQFATVRIMAATLHHTLL